MIDIPTRDRRYNRDKKPFVPVHLKNWNLQSSDLCMSAHGSLKGRC